MRKRTPTPRNRPNCFVVVSFEGCWMPEVCQAPHYFVDCDRHGTLAKVHNEETARFILKGHKALPIWPSGQLPPNDGSRDRIAAAQTEQSKGSRIFVPSTYTDRSVQK